MAETLPPDTQRSTRRRKVQAVLAGGIVLGVGAVVTLAAWNDSQFAQGFFNTGQYTVESSADAADSGYEYHSSAEDAAALTFNADNALPNQAYAAPLWLRVDEDTTANGEISDITVTVGEDTPVYEFSYEIFLIPVDETCTQWVDSTRIADGETLDRIAFDAGPDTTLSTGADNSPGTPVQLCFVVETSEELTQGTTASVTWEVHTQSLPN